MLLNLWVIMAASYAASEMIIAHAMRVSIVIMEIMGAKV